MSPLAVVLVYVAAVVVALRGPLAFAPDATVARLERWFFSSDERFRLVGLGMLVGLAAPLIVAARTTPGAYPTTRWVEALGWLVVAGGACVVIAPTPTRRMVEGIIGGAPTSALRAIGVINIAFGAFLVWVAVTAL